MRWCAPFAWAGEQLSIREDDSTVLGGCSVLLPIPAPATLTYVYVMMVQSCSAVTVLVALLCSNAIAVGMWFHKSDAVVQLCEDSHAVL